MCDARGAKNGVILGHSRFDLVLFFDKVKRLFSYYIGLFGSYRGLI